MKRYFRHFSPCYDIDETYHIEELKDESDYVIRELQRLEEEKQKLEKYLSEISNRASEVLQLEYYYFIEVRRQINLIIRLIILQLSRSVLLVMMVNFITIKKLKQ